MCNFCVWDQKLAVGARAEFPRESTLLLVCSFSLILSFALVRLLGSLFLYCFDLYFPFSYTAPPSLIMEVERFSTPPSTPRINLRVLFSPPPAPARPTHKNQFAKVALMLGIPQHAITHYELKQANVASSIVDHLRSAIRQPWQEQKWTRTEYQLLLHGQTLELQDKYLIISAKTGYEILNCLCRADLYHAFSFMLHYFDEEVLTRLMAMAFLFSPHLAGCMYDDGALQCMTFQHGANFGEWLIDEVQVEMITEIEVWEDVRERRFRFQPEQLEQLLEWYQFRSISQFEEEIQLRCISAAEAA